MQMLYTRDCRESRLFLHRITKMASRVELELSNRPDASVPPTSGGVVQRTLVSFEQPLHCEGRTRKPRA
jgi:hypothetical protein